jgi:hypothetical protein
MLSRRAVHLQPELNQDPAPEGGCGWLRPSFALPSTRRQNSQAELVLGLTGPPEILRFVSLYTVPIACFLDL